jgi:YD repeat-containing protein
LARVVRLRALRWWLAAVTALALLVAGFQGAAQQAASAAPRHPAATAARPAATPPLSAKGAAVVASVAASQAQAQARQSGQATAVAADQTDFSQTVANPNGSFTTTSSVQPRWVKSGSSWVNADPTLVKQPDGSYAPKAAAGALTLSGGGTGALASEGAGSARLSVTWPQALPAPQVSGAQATYPDVLPGVDLVVTAGAAGQFSDTLVIKDKAAAADPGLADLKLGVSASGGLTARAGSDGSLAEDDSAGKAVFYSPPPLAWDSRSPGASVAGPGGPGAVVAPASYSAGSMELGVPASLAADPSADFPVYIDPSYNVSAWWWNYGMDQSAYPTLNDQNSTPGSLVGVGYNGGIDRGEFVFGPASPADSAPVTITSATLTDEAMTAGSSASTNHTVNVYSTSEYTTSSTWNSPPTTLAGPATATFTTTSATPDQNVSWNVASFLQAAYNANPWELSLQLQNADEADAAQFVGFSCNPTLTYTYTQPAPVIPAGTGPVSNATFLSFPISDKATLKVNVGSGDALITTSDLTLPEIGGNLTLGVDYNSLLATSVTGGAVGAGWRQRQGADTRLYLGAGTGTGTASGPVTYLGPDGLSGVFTPPASGNLYNSPAALHATLTNAPASPCGSGSIYQLTWHSTGQVMCFNNAGMLTSQYDRDGNDTAFSYLGNGQETQVTYTPEGLSSPTETVAASYTGSYLTGLSQSGGSAGTKTITYSTNSDGDLTLVKQADGITITMGYDGSEDPTSIENGTGATTQIAYNSAHQVTSVTQPYGSGTATATTRFSYVSATETQVAAPNTNQSDPVASVPNTTYTVNSQALVTATKDTGTNTTSTGYDPATNNVTSYENQLNGTTKNTWGANNGQSLTSSLSPTSALQSWAFNNKPTTADPTYAYLPSSSTDAQNNATAYTYDGPGDLQSSQNALAATASVHYNGNGTVQYSTTPAPDMAQTNYTPNPQNPAQITEITPRPAAASSPHRSPTTGSAGSRRSPTGTATRSPTPTTSPTGSPRRPSLARRPPSPSATPTTGRGTCTPRPTRPVPPPGPTTAATRSCPRTRNRAAGPCRGPTTPTGTCSPRPTPEAPPGTPTTPWTS